LSRGDEPAGTVAVIGRNAAATGNMQGNYYGTAPYLISPVAGIGAYTKTETCDGSDVDAAVAMAEAAKAVVLVVGLTSEGAQPADEAEGHDRTSLVMPYKQDDLVARVAAAAAAKGVPVVMVVMSGGPVDLTAAKADPNVGAIIWCGYPGQSGGAAIADAIFGTSTPSAKLSMTWYPQSLAEQVALTDMGMRPNKTTGNPGRSHRFYTGEPVYPFGHGLSYTSFAARLLEPAPVIASSAWEELTLSALSKQAAATFLVEVNNTGDRDGAEVVLLFGAPPDAGLGGRPLQSLLAFERVHLRRGESAVLTLPVEARHFTLADRLGARFVPKEKGGEWKLWLGPQGREAARSVKVI